MIGIKALIMMIMAAVMIAPAFVAAARPSEGALNTPTVTEAATSTPTTLVKVKTLATTATTTVTVMSGGRTLTITTAETATPTTAWKTVTVLAPKLPMSTITLDARGQAVETKRKTFDPNIPMRPHTCPLDAMAALANWRLFCTAGVKPAYCGTKAPSLERCCTKWVKKTDKKYKNYPSWLGYKHGYPQWDGDLRQKAMLGWDEYNAEDKVCRDWRTEDDEQYRHFTQNLSFYKIDEDEENERIDYARLWS